MLPQDRRRILRKRNLLYQGINAFRLVRKYRRRPKQAFEEITSVEKPPECEIQAQQLEDYWNSKYAQEKQTQVPINQYMPLPPQRDFKLREITVEDVKGRISRLKDGKSAETDGITYEIWKLFPCLAEWLQRIFVQCMKWKKMPLA